MGQSGFWGRIGTFLSDKRVYIIVAAVSLAVGLGFAAVFATAVDKTSTLAFCANSCHEMQATVYQEYTRTVHFRNPHGVVVTCADCHIPKGNWTAVAVDKVGASSELWHHIVDRYYILAKFNAARPALEKKVLAEFAETNARACKTCHHWNNMILARQNEAARAMHSQAMKTDANCLDCHKGVAHTDVLSGATAPASYALTDTAPAAESVAPPAAQNTAAGGQAIYEKNCSACHTAMSPKLGDKAAWTPLLKLGDQALINATIRGKGIMPPRGGNASLSDADIKAAVAYIIAKAK